METNYAPLFRPISLMYGQLIAILLCSSTMFRMHNLLLTKKKRELSEYKAIDIITDYFPLLFQTTQKTPKSYQRSSFACSTSYSETGENPTVIRKKRSLIS
ncbi:hypothetical protein HMPREF0083_04134 [Aneurinibacillus aneurinilyticus ATCC 12856]|uniref:Uncharacterized protein n=1 Tax=Aneurinibacillus aneurinilyticus ATCC 12856 TaxID=649747 RepID=U1WYP4_ANEAE|nr:hypothetical protein HMPREF0083_04134 [Aneurinibacillus aneurinilyticus ATCC 12856]